MEITCVFVVPADTVDVYLRRHGEKCPASKLGYHNAMTLVGRMPAVKDEAGFLHQPMPTPPQSDPRWPSKCACGHAFAASDPWQVFFRDVYRAPDGTEHNSDEMPPGWMWNSSFAPDCWKGADGLSLWMRLPGGYDWNIDGPARNCPIPNDHAHRCWTRTGTPPKITVGKSGVTCAAGAGSIAVPGFHGFLTDGMLRG